MDEFEIIRRYFVRQIADDAVRLGIGDDGAVLSPEPDRQLVCVVDSLVDGVHYPAGLAACDIGYRAVAVNLSDLAAMGARPRWMTLALTLSRNDAEWLEGFAVGLFEAASAWNVSLVGGDTTRGEQTVISVEILGDVERDAFLARSGARPGDDLYVTGTPGDAAGGLKLIMERPDRAADADPDRDYLRRRFTRPAARVAFAAAIARIATAAIDISDGLFADAGKLLTASNAGARLDLERLPLSAELRRVFGDAQAERFALSGGDDYELCFTADAADANLRSIADRLGLRVTCIGTVLEGRNLVVCRDGEPVEFSDDGYRHFQVRSARRASSRNRGGFSSRSPIHALWKSPADAGAHPARASAPATVLRMTAELRRQVLRDPVLLAAFGFGAGLSPRAPGTVGSLLGVLFALAAIPLPLPGRLAIGAALVIAGTWLCGAAARRVGVHDHPGIVWDEIAAVYLLLQVTPPSIGLWALGFGLFRLFDIVKPWPIRDLDHRLGGGAGIMLDDLAAALYAASLLGFGRWLLL